MHALLAILAVAAPPVPDACVDCRTSTEFLAVAKARRLHIETIAPSTRQDAGRVFAHAQSHLGGLGLQAWVEFMRSEAKRTPDSVWARVAELGRPDHEALCVRLEVARGFRAWQRFELATIDCGPGYLCLPDMPYEQPTLDLLTEIEALSREHDIFGPCRDAAQDMLASLLPEQYPDRQSRPLLEGTAFFTCGFRTAEGSATCARDPLRAPTRLELPTPNPNPWGP